jgi:dCMP deaminase
VKRATWDETGMRMADAIALRSACERRQCGAVIFARDNRLVAAAYNGPPAGYDLTCRSCPRNISGDAGVGYDNCVSLHAEANGIAVGDRREREGGTIYITSAPCRGCAFLISNSGLARAVFRILPEDAHRQPSQSVNVLRDSGLEVLQWRD